MTSFCATTPETTRHDRRLTLLLAATLIAAWCHPARSALADAAAPSVAMVHATCKILHPTSTATGFLIEDPRRKDTPPAAPAARNTPSDSTPSKQGDASTSPSDPTASAEDAPFDCLLVTAAHVFEQAKGDTVRIVFRKALGDGSYTRFEVPLVIRLAPKEGEPVETGQPRWLKHKQLDVAVLPIQLPSGVSNRPIPSSWLAREADLRKRNVNLSTEVSLMGYPARVEANGAGFPITRHGAIAGFPIVPVRPHSMIMLDVASYGGDSGGPVFIVPRPRVQREPDDKESIHAGGAKTGMRVTPLVIGLVHGQIRQDERIKMIHEERVIHHKLDLAVMIQSEFIVETIAKLPPLAEPK